MAIDFSRFLARFVEEAREHITELNDGLVRLEKNPDDPKTINSVFRSAHTIKGSSKMMKLSQVTEVAHRMEDVLGALREKKMNHSKLLADMLFKGTDAISEMVEDVAAGRGITADNSALCEELKSAAIEAYPNSGPGGIREEAASGEKTLQELPAPVETDKKPRSGETIRVNAEKLDDLVKLMGEIISNQSRLKQRLIDVKGLERKAKKHLELLAGFGRNAAAIETLEVRETMDELIKAARSLNQKTRGLYLGLKDDVNIQELLNNELQEKALMMRTVPLSVVFDTLSRLSRDLSHTLGKEVDLVVEGGELDLDKKIAERIADPLMHMLRNSIDHGIETPDERRKQGKPERGSIRLSASCEAGSALIELSDDGAGIQIQKIRERALRKKLMDEERLESLPDSELIELIFSPGFSTREIITELSGRGVGLDVVKKNIVEELKGSIAVRTSEGKGTSFQVRLPLSLAIMRILFIVVSDTTIAVPAHYISEILIAREDELISVVDKKAIRLRSEIVPIVEVGKLLNLPSAGQEKKDKLLVIVVRMGNEKLGLIADALLDEKDGVIKPFPAHLKKVKLVSGVIISGNNELINVVHVPAIIESAKRFMRTYVKEAVRDEAAPIHILVVDDSLNTREIEKSILESYGYMVSVAEDGLDALEKASEFNFDLIITDIEMPRFDGFSLTESLRNNAAYKNTPIIIMTSREKEEDKRRGIQAGADAYILKGSFDQTNLLETVHNLVG